MKIYLINLDRHPERLAHMRKQLDGVAFERISAVDGSRRPPTTKGLTRFELACLESHRTAWRRFLASADSLACFLEDDLHVQPGFAALLSETKWIPEGRPFGEAGHLFPEGQARREAERERRTAKSPGSIRVTKAQRPTS